MVDTGGIAAKLGQSFGGAMRLSGDILIWILAGLLLGAIIWGILWYFSFKETVVIKRRVGKDYKTAVNARYVVYRPWWQFWKPKPPETIDQDKKEVVSNIPYLVTIYKAKIASHKDVKFLKLMFKSTRLKIPPNVYQNMTWKGRLYIELVQVNEHIFWPTVLVDAETAKHTMVPDEGYFSWQVRDQEKSFRKYATEPSFWDKYGNWIMTAGLLMVLVIALYIITKHWETMANMTAQGMDTLKDAVDSYNACKSTQVIP